jgi:hypothetical protein
VKTILVGSTPDPDTPILKQAKRGIREAAVAGKSFHPCFMPVYPGALKSRCYTN